MKFSRLFAAATALLLPFSLFAEVRVQLGNFAPLSANTAETALTVRINGQVVETDFTYGETHPYINLGGTGIYRFELIPAGATNPFVTADVSLSDGNDYTALAVGNNRTQPFGLLFLLDNNSPPPAGSARFRVIHAAPFATTASASEVTVRADNGAVLPGMERIPYATPSPYLTLTAATYDLQVTSPEGTITYVDLAPLALSSGTTRSFVFAGDGSAQDFGVFTLPGGIITDEPIVDQSASGAWTTGNAQGQGITLYAVPSENRLLGTWFTFTNAGQQLWYTLDTCGSQPGSGVCANPRAFDNNRAVMTVYETTGGRFLTADPVTRRVAGTLTIDFLSCTSAQAQYTIDGASGSFGMSNFIPSPDCTISN